MASAVAAALTEIDVDFWLDDRELGQSPPKSRAEHVRLTEAIETGLQRSTHLLAVITLLTEKSWWVPFEIGSCRALRKGLAFLIHRDVQELPSYMAVGRELADQQALYQWAQQLKPSPAHGGYFVPQWWSDFEKERPLDRYVEKHRSVAPAPGCGATMTDSTPGKRLLPNG
jgi:hypothetical protein